ncbi:hypothetical protein THRCLA_20622 [Thraustotheca clavata]|uniref:Ankyrin repeat n=1 Tax=Thraustotheca clavata TaxID=74557 RepID=A0A1W0A5F3_9STRA|nr:hypothetical protein THRCLA_20622 [Thraustotheca clavata]
MYQQCKKYFQNGSLFFNKFYVDDNSLPCSLNGVQVVDILAAAMENLWLDELHDMLQYPIALVQAAIFYCNLRFLQYLVANHDIDLTRLENILIFPSIFFTLDFVARLGHFDMLKYLYKAGIKKCTVKAMNNAARKSHFKIVKWLYENTTNGCSADILGSVLIKGHMKIVEYLQSELVDIYR